MTRFRISSLAVAFLVLLFFVLSSKIDSAATEVRGHLLIIGGGQVTSNILHRFIELAGGSAKARIVVIPMASAEPNETGASMVERLKNEGGVQEAKFLLISRQQAGENEIVHALD